ncbi:P-loop containing nucleoside triphosphate hydrolase protein [Clavulina sp. PMI_390]|nr:P-loop containing nucleoside triphosphate hydrolase protein [Clavulina sp. PMI_390]
MASKEEWEQIEADHPSVYEKWVDHFSSEQPFAEFKLINTLRTLYPDHAIVAHTGYNQMDFSKLPKAHLVPLSNSELPVLSTDFRPPARRRDGSGTLSQTVMFGGYHLKWEEHHFLLFVTEWREGSFIRRCKAVLHPQVLGTDAEALINSLFVTIGNYENELHAEILMYNNGYWSKDRALWEEVQKANWTDVILDEQFKSAVQNDITNFYQSESVFKNLAIPWKRGLIFHGPPGNGKTISIKAIMKSSEVPALYVKSFENAFGPQRGIRDVFVRARAMAPCLLILEDLDSLVTDKVRSYFLNELDGFEANDGVLLIGTTNHLDRLDPGLSNRPSRFDRKFEFTDPSLGERTLYCQYWQKKLSSNESIVFPESLVGEIANCTNGFSFAYLKEAFVSALVGLATGTETGAFTDVIFRRIAILREELEGKAASSDAVDVENIAVSSSVGQTPQHSPITERFAVTSSSSNGLKEGDEDVQPFLSRMRYPMRMFDPSY